MAIFKYAVAATTSHGSEHRKILTNSTSSTGLPEVAIVEPIHVHPLIIQWQRLPLTGGTFNASAYYSTTAQPTATIDLTAVANQNLFLVLLVTSSNASATQTMNFSNFTAEILE